MLAIDPDFKIYGNPWFSVQAGACTEIISFPYTPVRPRSHGSGNQPESGLDRRYTENSSFPYRPEEAAHQPGRSALRRLPLFTPKRTFGSALPNDCPVALFAELSDEGIGEFLEVGGTLYILKPQEHSRGTGLHTTAPT